MLYGGTELFDDEVRHTFHSDMMLAVVSGVCITVLVYVLTSFSGTISPYFTCICVSSFMYESARIITSSSLSLPSLFDFLRTR